MNGKELCANQLEHRVISFQCVRPRSYVECQEHRASLCASLIKRFVGVEPRVVDAGCGIKLLARHFTDYVGVDLVEGHNIEDSIPEGEVVVFMNVLEHVIDLKKVLENVRADYVYVSVPQEYSRMSSPDHVRHLTLDDIQRLAPSWELIGKWFWVLRPRFWRLRYLFPVVSVFAEDEISLWRVKK